MVFDGTIAVNGTLVGANDEGALSIVDLETGEMRTMSIEGEDFGAVPAFASRDGTLFYTHELSDTLYAIDSAAEEVLWQTEGELSRGRMLTVDGAVVLERDGDVRTLDIESGDILAAGQNPQLGSMLETDETVVYSCATSVQALDAEF